MGVGSTGVFVAVGVGMGVAVGTVVSVGTDVAVGTVVVAGAVVAAGAGISDGVGAGVCCWQATINVARSRIQNLRMLHLFLSRSLVGPGGPHSIPSK